MTRLRLLLAIGIVAALAVATAAWSDGGDVPAAAASPTGSAADTDDSAQERRALEGTVTFLDAFEREDLDTISNLVGDQVTLVHPLSFTGAREDAAQFMGKEQVLGYFRQVFTGMERISFVDRRVTVAAGGDTVFVQTNGELVGTDGAPYRNVYLFRYNWRDGLIVSGEEYYNPVTAAQRFNIPLG